MLRPVCVGFVHSSGRWGLALSNWSPLTGMQDLLKHTPSSHPDHPLLQDALRISQNFLSGINEEITPRRQSMTVKKGEVSVAGYLGLAQPELEDEEPVSGLQQTVPEQFGLTQETHCLLGFFTLVRQNPIQGIGVEFRGCALRSASSFSVVVGFVQGTPSFLHTLPARGPTEKEDSI